MTHEQRIKATCAQVFSVSEKDVTVIERLMGGMSNFTYVIDIQATRYTFRIPGKNADKFVNRDVEKDHLKIIEPLNLNNETVYLNTEDGVKIARYLVGQPLHELNPHDYLQEAANVLKTIHDSGITSPHAYAPLKRLERYEYNVKAYNHTHHNRYNEYKETLLKHWDWLNSFPKTLTHGDAQVSNFVVTDNALKLMDWEFTGMNDPFYDIACFGNTNFDHAIALLPVYLEHVPNSQEFNRLYLWRTFQCLQWHNVALYKEFIGLSQDLSVDFYKVAQIYLDKAEDLLAKLK